MTEQEEREYERRDQVERDAKAWREELLDALRVTIEKGTPLDLMALPAETFVAIAITGRLAARLDRAVELLERIERGLEQGAAGLR